MSDKSDFYLKSVKEVFEALKTNEKGLSSEEAEKRLNEYGENTLTTTVKTPWWLTFLLQFRDVLVIILIVAGVISFAIIFVNYLNPPPPELTCSSSYHNRS